MSAPLILSEATKRFFSREGLVAWGFLFVAAHVSVALKVGFDGLLDRVMWWSLFAAVFFAALVYLVFLISEACTRWQKPEQ